MQCMDSGTWIGLVNGDWGVMLVAVALVVMIVIGVLLCCVIPITRTLLTNAMAKQTIVIIKNDGPREEEE